VKAFQWHKSADNYLEPPTRDLVPRPAHMQQILKSYRNDLSAGTHPTVRARAYKGTGLLLLLLLGLLPRLLLHLLRGGQARVLSQLLIAGAPVIGLPRQASVGALQLSHAYLES